MNVIDVTEDYITVFIMMLIFIAFSCNFITKCGHVRPSIIDHQSRVDIANLQSLGYF